MEGELISRDWSFRPCVVMNQKAVFHGWTNTGQGIIEFENGRVEICQPRSIQFLDSGKMFDEQFMFQKGVNGNE